MKYRTIVADPPWPYPEGFVLGPGHGVFRTHDGPLPYQALSLENICALPVAMLAESDCRLFLWTTNRHLFDGFRVMRAWGFRYRQTLVWHKVDANIPASVAPNSAEFVLVGVRGEPERRKCLPSAVLAIARKGSHSTKPEAWMDHFEAVSPGPYVELFARRHRMGWDVHGFESANTVDWGSAV